MAKRGRADGGEGEDGDGGVLDGVGGDGSDARDTDSPPATTSAATSAATSSHALAAPSRAAGAPAAVSACARRALLELPSADMYEKSYMHREWITHIVTTASDFLVTASRDGHLKFWKKLQTGIQFIRPHPTPGIEFIKHFRAHMGAFSGVAASHDGTLLATAAADQGLKVFDFSPPLFFRIRRHTPFSPYVAPRSPHMSEINPPFFRVFHRSSTCSPST